MSASRFSAADVSAVVKALSAVEFDFEVSAGIGNCAQSRAGNKISNMNKRIFNVIAGCVPVHKKAEGGGKATGK